MRNRVNLLSFTQLTVAANYDYNLRAEKVGWPAFPASHFPLHFSFCVPLHMAASHDYNLGAVKVGSGAFFVVLFQLCCKRIVLFVRVQRRGLLSCASLLLLFLRLLSARNTT